MGSDDFSYAGIIDGGSLRKTRFHDEKGNFVGWKRLLIHGPPALASTLLRVAVNHRPVLPWIPYDAITYLENFLQGGKRVIEYGSGMSTLWYAQHADQVVSVENNPEWHKKINDIIKKRGITNATCEYAQNEEDYVNFHTEDHDTFDLAIIDGSFRSKCVERARELVRSGGVLYLDDSDKDVKRGGDLRRAEKLMREFANHGNSEVVEFTDFAPTQFFVQQSLAVQTFK